jgi:hypothetical protein
MAPVVAPSARRVDPAPSAYPQYRDSAPSASHHPSVSANAPCCCTSGWRHRPSDTGGRARSARCGRHPQPASRSLCSPQVTAFDARRPLHGGARHADGSGHQDRRCAEFDARTVASDIRGDRLASRSSVKSIRRASPLTTVPASRIRPVRRGASASLTAARLQCFSPAVSGMTRPASGRGLPEPRPSAPSPPYRRGPLPPDSARQGHGVGPCHGRRRLGCQS